MKKGAVKVKLPKRNPAGRNPPGKAGRKKRERRNKKQQPVGMEQPDKKETVVKKLQKKGKGKMSQNLNPIETEEQKEFFTSIYKEYNNDMMYLANSILGNPSDAKEVVHDSFLTIADHLDKLMCYELSKLWLYSRLLVKGKAEKLNQQKYGGKDELSELWEEIFSSDAKRGAVPL